jgi:uncharacterized membrane protein
MPFCTHCGHEAGASDQFCSSCGAAQGSGARETGAGTSPGTGQTGRRPGAPPRFPGDTNPRAVAALCYVPVLGWIACLYVLAGERFRRDHTIRFHAFQGLYLFVAWLVVHWAIGPLMGGWWRVANILKAVISIVGVVMLIKTLKNQDERLPLVGDLADRSVREQQ